jgi:hypothetical protein
LRRALLALLLPLAPEYNVKVPPPHSFDDLMIPLLRKKIALPDDPYAVITTFALILGVLKPPYPTNNLTQDQLNEVLDALYWLRASRTAADSGPCRAGGPSP